MATAVISPPNPHRRTGFFSRWFDLDAILMLCQRDLIRFFRERAQLYGSLARTVVWLFILGAGLRGSVNVPGDISYLEFVFPGMLAMAVIFSSMQSAISIIFDREFGFLKEILVAPIPRTSVAIGKALAGALISTVQASLIFLFAPFADARLSVPKVIACLGILVLMGLGLTGIGIMMAARMTSFEGFGTINNFVILPLYFTSAAQFPLDRAPHWLRIVSHANPLSYGVDLLRGVLSGVWTYSAWLDLLVVGGFAVIAVAGATYAFTRTE
jgi:ABC-2 type transport system permease protein